MIWFWLPTSLLRMRLCLVFEPATGIRASLMRTLNEFLENRMERIPPIRAKAYFRLAWLHALVTERSRYIPLGWSKHYEINESDLRFACDTIDQWIRNEGKDDIAWDALRYLIASCIYGGRLDNRFDQRLLAAFVAKLFCQESLNTSYPLIKDDVSLLTIPMPQDSTKHKYVDWLKQLPSNEKLTWLGLPDNAEKVLLISEGSKFAVDLLKCDQNDENTLSINLDVDEHKEEGDTAGRPAWMIQVQHTTGAWLKSLPKSLPTMTRTSENIKDPLFRCVEREVNFAANLLGLVRQDLADVQSVCDGSKKQTNDTRDLLNNLSKGITPSTWKKYRVPPRISAMQWMSDFVARLKQLDKLATLTTNEGVQSLRHVQMWLGGLFTPEAYLTATRQCAAQSLHVSLEELIMHVQMLDQPSQVDSKKENVFIITGLKLQGASCRNNALFYSSSIMDDIPLLTIQWKMPTSTTSSQKENDQQEVTLPVYGNALRTELLSTINVKAGQANTSEFHFYERGVAVLASSLD